MTLRDAFQNRKRKIAKITRNRRFNERGEKINSNALVTNIIFTNRRNSRNYISRIWIFSAAVWRVCRLGAISVGFGDKEKYPIWRIRYSDKFRII